MAARIAAIVLAAGRSSRMAPRNKLLEPVGGQAIVARVAAAAIASGADPVVVVTGFEAARVAEALSGLNVVVLHNPAFAEGLSTSLRAGLKALPPNCDGALVLLGDMPEIEIGDLHALMRAFTARDAICVPVHQGKRGNPILWGASYFAEMTDADRRRWRQAAAGAARASRDRSAGRVFQPFSPMSIRRPILRGSRRRSDRGGVSRRADARAARSRARSKAPARSA